VEAGTVGEMNPGPLNPPLFATNTVSFICVRAIMYRNPENVFGLGVKGAAGCLPRGRQRRREELSQEGGSVNPRLRVSPPLTIWRQALAPAGEEGERSTAGEGQEAEETGDGKTEHVFLHKSLQ